MKINHAVLALLVSISAHADTWQTLKNCTFIAHRQNDGDSFRIRWNDSNIVVRLNFIDTPESSFVYGDRLTDQAKYFNIRTEQTVQIGKDAAAFTESHLQSNRFDVVTHWQNASGAASAHRVYAFVKVGGNDLAELLVSNGLARIYGEANSQTNQATTAKLKLIEATAKSAMRGAWALSSTNENAELAETGWRISGTGVRHNSKCKFYNSPSCHPCLKTDGTPCKVCGG